jgi:hypothetical protein
MYGGVRRFFFGGPSFSPPSLLGATGYSPRIYLFLRPTKTRASHPIPGVLVPYSFIFPPTPSLGPPRHTHAHNQGDRRKELAQSCRCREAVRAS